MRKQFFYKKCFRIIVLFFTVFIIGLSFFHFSPLKWYMRQDCLCGRAYFHPGKSFDLDEMLLREIEPGELSDGVFSLLYTNCKRHNVHIWVRIWGKTSYSVRIP